MWFKYNLKITEIVAIPHKGDLPDGIGRKKRRA
ncbi:Uncharacterised protein [Candidatus Ornithobacterium hominis]|uniref:Uncharacterized protein n=1 Tax=Candidatus Ornithobacterium hominis TaxID=2497989 RepID=A0A383U0Q1_9FLAO|nr:Uncharacterised protein [Candidatus Ornithobacterium hominis]